MQPAAPGDSQSVVLALQNASDYEFSTKTVIRTSSPRLALSVVAGAAQTLRPHSAGKSEVRVNFLSPTVDEATETYFETVELLVEAGDYSKVVRLHCLCVDTFCFVPARGRLYACATIDSVSVDLENPQADAKHAGGPVQLQKCKLELLNYAPNSVAVARYSLKKCREELDALKLVELQPEPAEAPSDARAPSASKKRKVAEDAGSAESDVVQVRRKFSPEQLGGV